MKKKIGDTDQNYIIDFSYHVRRKNMKDLIVYICRILVPFNVSKIDKRYRNEYNGSMPKKIIITLAVIV